MTDPMPNAPAPDAALLDRLRASRAKCAPFQSASVLASDVHAVVIRLEHAERLSAENAALAQRAAAAEAEAARLREALERINRRASPAPERTIGECCDAAYWCASEARRAFDPAEGR